jgi:hypothetical protein
MENLAMIQERIERARMEWSSNLASMPEHEQKAYDCSRCKDQEWIVDPHNPWVDTMCLCQAKTASPKNSKRIDPRRV